MEEVREKILAWWRRLKAWVKKILDWIARHWYDTRAGYYIYKRKWALRHWISRKIADYYKARDTPFLKDHALEVIRQVHAWYAADPNRWITGAWHSPRAGGSESYVLTDRSQYGTKKYWSLLEKHQAKDTLAACLMGGFEKFAWEVLGKPNMSKSWHQNRVSRLAGQAGLQVLLAEGDAQAQMWAKEGLEYDDLGGRVEGTITGTNDRGGYHYTQSRLEMALAEGHENQS